ncbi:MAG TPA: DNA repair protein RecN [Solirubrobacteraceae bacterium]|nr:DNA repair protein RecN [Solirubrobacteraceae bacterium]
MTVLEELRVENLLLLERAELRLAEGLNVLTGETGAGKTILAHALELLLGGRARGGIVRRGANEAYVEGVFSLPERARRPPHVSEGVAEILDRLPADADELVLARRVWGDGRTRAYLCGRSVTVAELREIGAQLLTFYGQHEHRKLTIGRAQLELLDASCGPEHAVLRDQLAAAHAKARELERRLSSLEEVAGARERELDLLAFELEEIEAAAPTEEEESDLSAERDRLSSADRLQAAAAAGAEAIVPEAGEGALELLSAPLRELESVANLDPSLQPLSERWQALMYEFQDLGRGLRDYALAQEAPPGRLEEVEERLERFARLKRKHGGSIGEVLEYAQRCRERRSEIEHADVALQETQSSLKQVREELALLAGKLSAGRNAAAPKLAEAVKSRLDELALADAEFAVQVCPRADGIGNRGGDAVEFKFSANPGVSAGPLREIASGGELSRVMLALLTAADGRPRRSGDGALRGKVEPLLVFDEVDAGVGGHTARAVGEHLRALARGRQVLCITHLPQIASLADRHFRIDKRTAHGVTVAQVSRLDGDEVVAELVRMLGASEQDSSANEHARRLLQAA